MSQPIRYDVTYSLPTRYPTRLTDPSTTTTYTSDGYSDREPPTSKARPDSCPRCLPLPQQWVSFTDHPEDCRTRALFARRQEPRKPATASCVLSASRPATTLTTARRRTRCYTRRFVPPTSSSVPVSTGLIMRAQDCARAPSQPARFLRSRTRQASGLLMTWIVRL